MFDVDVTIAMKEGSDYDAAMNLRQRLANEVQEDAKVMGVGGGVSFEPLIADESFACANRTFALGALKTLTEKLVDEGYRVTAYEGEPDYSLEAGEAVVMIRG